MIPRGELYIFDTYNSNMDPNAVKKKIKQTVGFVKLVFKQGKSKRKQFLQLATHPLVPVADDPYFGSSYWSLVGLVLVYFGLVSRS